MQSLLRVKDLFTGISILLGYAVLPLCVRGHFGLASVVMILGAVTDFMDGFYARLTNTGNRFGAELDVIADLIIYSNATAVLLFFTLRPYGGHYYAAAIGVLPLLSGCFRLARFNVKRIEYPGYWVGLTRPAFMIVVVAFVNSSLFQTSSSRYVTPALVLILSILNISLIPYIGHHRRTFTKMERRLAYSLGVTLLIAGVFGIFWDALFFLGVLYVLSPIGMPEAERRRFRAFIRTWLDEETDQQ